MERSLIHPVPHGWLMLVMIVSAWMRHLCLYPSKPFAKHSQLKQECSGMDKLSFWLMYDFLLLHPVLGHVGTMSIVVKSWSQKMVTSVSWIILTSTITKCQTLITLTGCFLEKKGKLRICVFCKTSINNANIIATWLAQHSKKYGRERFSMDT